MKNLLLAASFAAVMLLSGCGAVKTAADHGSGLSVEMKTGGQYRHVQLIRYENGERVPDENVVNADGSQFEDGEVIWFDIQPGEWKETTAFALSVSTDGTGVGARQTKPVELKDGTSWAHAVFNDDGLTIEEAE
ncbi:hypothetical protein C772_01814 [Bhargavaea cecembensis DSE10]|uniref:Lipoprotein n=1 Tax=Bhargavaea cecembensis DSE10 TaxID=1235279 RepID=M7P6L6_9BACL|nr:hypothetical protein [Bhargavaea cecembensis]EMR06169.1 hypothetical protein C772_01814 [Bhargavaea cecembensis DSE10]